MYPQFGKNPVANVTAMLCLVVLLFAGPTPATAADFGGAPQQGPAEPLPPPNQWQFSFTPYGWLIGVNGDVEVRGHSISFNESFIDLVDDSDSLAALMGYFEARKGPFALFTDIVWADLNFPGSFNRQSDPLPNLNILVSGKGSLDYELTIIQAGAAYEVARWQNGGATTAVDMMASARYWSQSADVSATVTATAALGGTGFGVSGRRAVAGSGTLEWVDPVVGGRIRQKTASGSELTLLGDIGGFGVGSDFSWQVVATYGFETMLFGTPFETVIGYRALSTDYSENGRFGKNGVDATFHGPIIGAKFRW